MLLYTNKIIFHVALVYILSLCLKKDITVFQLVPNTTTSYHELRNGRANFIIPSSGCQEYIFKLRISSVLGEKISNKYSILPVISHHRITKSKRLLKFFLTKSRFTHCKNVNIRLQCRGRNSSSIQAFTITDMKICRARLKDFKICRAKVFITKDKFMRQRRWTEWFKVEEDKISPILESGTISLLIVIVSVLLLISLLYLRLHNDVRDVDSFAFLEDVGKEFDKLEEHVKKEIQTEESYSIATENLARNRYKDISPYDFNLVTLSRTTGNKYQKFSQCNLFKIYGLVISNPQPNLSSTLPNPS